MTSSSEQTPGVNGSRNHVYCVFHCRRAFLRNKCHSFILLIYNKTDAENDGSKTGSNSIERSNLRLSLLGLSRLCSATFEQLLAFGATFCGFSNLEQVLPFRAIFEQNIGLEHISSTKKSTISWKTSIHANFLKAYHVINLLNT